MLRENTRIMSLRSRLAEVREELQQALAEETQGEVKDYEFGTPKGPVKLSQLFGGKRDLFVIHNMGVTCPNCTMWADGFNGLYPHVADRAAFVVASPDAPEKQAAFAKERGWRFPMVSDSSRAFFKDMGFLSAKGAAQPGVSAFQKEGSKVIRVSAAGFDEDDDFCPTWRLFDMLPEGADGWRAKFNYG
ncbi:MAG TPA: DUF899 family protein [Hyphomonadaceae bacterium]|nr:DUF899 family protein [Hyphomonadaceae bacterium]